MNSSSARATVTVVFLFTDIEGSTRLLQAHPDAYRSAVRRHHELLRQAVETQGGVVFETVGDAVYASFPRPAEALAAALEGQRALHAEPWGELGTLKVRMGLHLGEVEPQGSHYFGAPLYRCARLMSTAHGGQIVLSGVVATAVSEPGALPGGASLRDLGEHRLKDLPEPEHIYQLVHPALPAEFPPLRSLEPRPHNLPSPPSAFVGRWRELAELQRRLRDPKVRLLTLTGPGGTGKTRLSLQAGHHMLDEFRDGVWFVELASVSDPALVPSAIAQVLGVKADGERTELECLKERVRGRQMLLLLDNFEQVTTAAPVVVDLLRAGAELKVLVTSRALLWVSGEHDYPVPPMALPDLKALPPAERLMEFDSVRLFVERATAVRSDFRLSEENAAAVAEICSRLDGLPLAIELAAARVRQFPPPMLLRRLPSRLALSASNLGDLPARQRTLRGAIAWSYDLLSVEERALFRQLGVFVGGCTFQAVEAVCEGTEGFDILDGLASLADKSLLRQDVEPDGEPRFLILETIREYAWERASAEGNPAGLRQRHAAYFLALAEEADGRLRGPEQLVWFDRLGREHDNVRAALSWALENAEAEVALRLCVAMMWFWGNRGHLAEGRRWAEAALQKGRGAPEGLRAKALLVAASLGTEQGDFAVARTHCLEALELLRPLGDLHGIAMSLSVLGNATRGLGDPVKARGYDEESLSLRRQLGDARGAAYVLRKLGWDALARRDYAAARAYFEENVAIFRGLGDRMYFAAGLSDLGRMALAEGDFATARTRLEECLGLLRETGDPHEIAHCLTELGRVGLGEGDYPRATAPCDEALAHYRALGAKTGIATALHVRGLVALRRGELALAESLFEESLSVCREQGDKCRIAASLVGLARLAGMQQQPDRAAGLLAAAQALLERSGSALDRIDQTEFDEAVVHARGELGDTLFAAVWAEGTAMTPEQAVVAYRRGKGPFAKS
ncbi:tetratricopeptide repeat protein [Archangium violaceum]|uniref:ATP-binding protein n=1 Tax=Archangium violaceum TaxID=83451 RepID=UPI00194F68BF|nr:tetratricopeptide repeat protein [Archangium violaceum]QRN97056.1 tetratricopeptide repeat protein [Archangium violaceum]